MRELPTEMLLHTFLPGFTSYLCPFSSVQHACDVCVQFHGIQRHARYGELPQHTRMLESCKAILKVRTVYRRYTSRAPMTRACCVTD